VLFVLKRLMERPAPRPVTTCAVAFGPGLTVETAVLERVGVPAPALAGTLHGTDA
jgi:predicted naringenin-chalcone synthase